MSKGRMGEKGLCSMAAVELSSCVYTNWKSMLSNSALCFGVVINVNIVIIRDVSANILSSRLKESEKKSFISSIVCKITSYMVVFRDFCVFSKCFLVIDVRGPVICCAVCLCACEKSASYGVVCVNN